MYIGWNECLWGTDCVRSRDHQKRCCNNKGFQRGLSLLTSLGARQLLKPLILEEVLICCLELGSHFAEAVEVFKISKQIAMPRLLCNDKNEFQTICESIFAAYAYLNPSLNISDRDFRLIDRCVALPMKLLNFGEMQSSEKLSIKTHAML